MRKVLLQTVLLISVLFSVSLAGVGIVSAPETPHVSVQPLCIWDPNMGPGADFTISVYVEDIEITRRLWGYQLRLGYDPTILEGVSFADGPFLSSFGGNAVPMGGTFDNVAGEMDLSGASLIPKANLVYGDGILAYVTFKVKGYGSTAIRFLNDTALSDKFGGYIVNLSEMVWDPSGGGGEGEWVPENPPHTPEAFTNGYFSNVEGPELYVRRRGCEGVTGIWEEWQVGDPGQEQILYNRIMNYGIMSAWIRVKFIVRSAYGTEEYWADETEIGPCVLEGNKWIPDSAEVNTGTFTPPGPGKYYNMVALFFKAGDMADYYPYFETGLEGEGISRDTNTAWKVQED